MISLAEFDGIAGYQWGALWSGGGALKLSQQAPQDAANPIGVVARVLAQAPFQMPRADLFFRDKRLLVRQGDYGLLLLSCDKKVNAALIDVVIMESDSPSTPSNDAQTDSAFSAIHSLGDSTIPVPGPIIDELMELLTQVLGPLAQAIAARECKIAGLDLSSVASREWSKLLNVLAGRIDNEEKRERFLDQAVLLKVRF